MSRVALATVLLIAGCSKKPDDPEAQVRAAVVALEEAAEARDLGRIKDLVAEQFRGPNGNDRQKLVAMLQFQFLRRKSVHIAQQVESVRLIDPDTAEVELVAGVAATPVGGLTDLANASADLFEVKFGFARISGDWLLTSATWKRARPSILE